MRDISVPERHAAGLGCLLVGKALDGDEMQRRTLLVRQLEKGFAHLRQADGMLLRSLRAAVGELSRLLEARRFGPARPQAVDEGVVDNRQQPGAQIAAGAEGAAPLIGPHQRVMDQVLGLGAVARQRARVAAQRTETGPTISKRGIDRFMPCLRSIGKVLIPPLSDFFAARFHG